MTTSHNGWPVLDKAPAGKLKWITGTVLEGDVTVLFEYLCREFDSRVEKIKVGESCGWAHRYIKGTNTWSNHSSGTAIDLNPNTHAYGKVGTFNNAQKNEIKAILNELGNVIGWGGDYPPRSTADEMHFEINANSTKVREVAEKLRRSHPTVTIPDGIGTIMTYMGYHKITSTSSNQYKLKKKAEADGKYTIKKPEYYAQIDGRILIATKQNIGDKLRVEVGDYVDVYHSSNTTAYKCIIGDIKGIDAKSIWGHIHGSEVCVVEIIYHDYSPPNGYNPNKNNPWGKGKVTKITKVGEKYKY